MVELIVKMNTQVANCNYICKESDKMYLSNDVVKITIDWIEYAIKLTNKSQSNYKIY